MITEKNKTVRKKKQRKTELFDSLVLVSRDAKGDTVWKGRDGSKYVFCKLDGGEGRPVVKVIRDGKFLTGLFKTKYRGIYSGDILLRSGKNEVGKVKRFLRLEVVTREKVNLYI